MKAFSRWRRIAVAATGIAAAALLCRPQLADALVARGDDYLYRGNPDRALAMYRRAIALDGDDAAAQDRFAFVALQVRDAAAMREALQRCGLYLRRHPGDATLLMDRAMLHRAVGDPQRAFAEFARAGAIARDPRAYAFAGFEAELLGLHALARRYWHAAIALQPGFPAALHALRHRRTR